MNIEGRQLYAPIPSHGMGHNAKCASYLVRLPNTVAGDTIEFGWLPRYAVPINAMLHAEGSFTGDVSIGGEKVFTAQAVAGETVVRPTLWEGFGAASDEPVKVTGRATGSGTVGRLILTVFYDIEDPEAFADNKIPAGAITLNSIPIALNGVYVTLGA